jgi:hypothetical protein
MFQVFVAFCVGNVRNVYNSVRGCKAVLNERIDFVITVENLVILPENVIVIQTE